MRYSLSSLKTLASQRRKLITEFNGYVQNGLKHRTNDCYNKEGIEILNKDWDNLIILDACRFDVFSDLADELPGELKQRESKAGSTKEFLLHNFKDQTIQDTIYITANPQLYWNNEEIDVDFFKVFDVWIDNWAEDVRTVKPDVVTEKALSVADEYPDKRLVIHYLQPHAPFIGPTGKRLPTDYLNFWDSYKSGEFDIDLEIAKQAYRENVKLVIPHVEQLLYELKGKTIVTADHAELLGERDSPIPIRRYGHPAYTYMSELVEIPWLIYQNGIRKNITSEEIKTEQTNRDVEDETVKKRLKDIGYA